MSLQDATASDARRGSAGDCSRVLLAQLPRFTRDRIKSHLESVGYQVTSVASAITALHAARELACNIILIGELEDSVDGFVLCGEMRNARVPERPFIIALTAARSLEDRISALTAGTDDAVSLDMPSRELMARLHVAERTLHRQRRRLTSIAGCPC